MDSMVLRVFSSLNDSLTLMKRLAKTFKSLWVSRSFCQWKVTGICYQILFSKRGSFVTLALSFLFIPQEPALLLWIWGFVTRTFLLNILSFYYFATGVGKCHSSEIFVERFFHVFHYLPIVATVLFQMLCAQRHEYLLVILGYEYTGT